MVIKMIEGLLLVIEYDKTKYPHLNNDGNSKEICSKYYKKVVDSRNKLRQISHAIDPTDCRFYLISNPELNTAILNISNEIAFVISSFVEYLVIPQTTNMRSGYFEIVKENVEDGLIKEPCISSTLINYILYSILPYSTIKEYNPLDVADIQAESKEAYEVVVSNEHFEVIPKIMFTDIELQEQLSFRNIPLTKDACCEWRLFLRKLINSLIVSLPDKELDSLNYLQMIQQLQLQTWIIRGIEMDKEHKTRNALIWIISGGTDWLEKREIEQCDIELGFKILLGEDGKEYYSSLLSIINEDKNIDCDVRYARQFFLEHDLLISINLLYKFEKGVEYILTSQDILGWIEERLNMFAQL
jgi:hypothetical protein